MKRTAPLSIVSAILLSAALAGQACASSADCKSGVERAFPQGLVSHAILRSSDQDEAGSRFGACRGRATHLVWEIPADCGREPVRQFGRPVWLAAGALMPLALIMDCSELILKPVCQAISRLRD